MRLTNIKKITGTIELVTGLHIGGSDTPMSIGGTDTPVIKNPISQQPYIPGSSIKGKMRSLLEWDLGVVGLGVCEGKPLSFEHLTEITNADEQQQAKTLLKLFGGAPKPDTSQDLIIDIGPTRLSFWDCELDQQWVEARGSNLLTEVKTENTIDRIKGGAEHPRHVERVPAGSQFQFVLSMRVHDDEDLTPMLIRGLHLLQLTGLGGSSSRGYGKIKLCLNDQTLQQQLDQLDKRAQEALA
ncbi:MAG TPA: type III-A CRISPR-associated RAMP protein Csm3 [Thiothrix sp.]|nr:type III-A CRISPR-associated RAMP protein Csm3 [Thiothrix sp.]